MKSSKLKVKSWGFTLIELLIVIAVLGVLVVAVLSAINPLEQMRKARDAGRKSDAAELLNALERYYTTFGCYTWDTACDGTGVLSGSVNSTFGAGGNVQGLIDKDELKTQFVTRTTITGKELWMTEATGKVVSVCFEPESTSARTGGLGPTRNITNTAAATCTGTYSGGGASATCYVCVPQ